MTTAPVSTAATVWKIVRGVSDYWLLVAALNLGVFDILEGATKRDEELADELGLDLARLSPVVDALAALGLLRGGADGRSLAPASSAHLVSGSDRYMGSLVAWSPGLQPNLEALAATVRGAEPPIAPSEEFHAQLAAATFRLQLDVAREAFSSHPLDELSDDVRGLDVGSGLGPWSVALLQRYPRATATLIDFPAVLAPARRMLAERDVIDRAELVAADHRTVAFPTVDLLVLGHLCRSQGEDGARSLIARAAAALAPGGFVVITDYILDDDRSGPLPAISMGVTMLANSAGRTFTRSEFTTWVHGAGLELVATADTGAGNVLVARRSTR